MKNLHTTNERGTPKRHIKETEIRYQWKPHPIAYNCREGLEKAMAPHSSTSAWKIPWTEEPDGLQSMGSLRIRHD